MPLSILTILMSIIGIVFIYYMIKVPKFDKLIPSALVFFCYSITLVALLYQFTNVRFSFDKVFLLFFFISFIWFFAGIIIKKVSLKKQSK